MTQHTTMPNMIPLQDRILVQRLEEDDKTPGGLLIPDTAKEKPSKGKVIAVGPGLRDKSGQRQTLDVKEGDIILFGKWSGTEVKTEGKEYLIMKESDVFALIKN